MIPLEYALKEISCKSSLEIKGFVKDCISEKFYPCVGSGHSTINPEDFIIQLLDYTGLEKDKRALIIDSCREVYKDMLENFNNSSQEDYKSCLINLCRVIDMAGPPELEKETRQFFNHALSLDFILSENLGASVRAFMSYAKQPDIKFIEDEILTNKEICVYGFNSMLDVGQTSDKIYEYLKELYQKQYNDDWPVNCIFLTKRTSRLLEDESFPVRILRDLKENNLVDWRKLKEDLDEKIVPDSKKWLEELAH